MVETHPQVETEVAAAAKVEDEVEDEAEAEVEAVAEAEVTVEFEDEVEAEVEVAADVNVMPPASAVQASPEWQNSEHRMVIAALENSDGRRRRSSPLQLPLPTCETGDSLPPAGIPRPTLPAPPTDDRSSAQGTPTARRNPLLRHSGPSRSTSPAISSGFPSPPASSRLSDASPEAAARQRGGYGSNQSPARPNPLLTGSPRRSPSRFDPARSSSSVTSIGSASTIGRPAHYPSIQYTPHLGNTLLHGGACHHPVSDATRRPSLASLASNRIGEGGMSVAEQDVFPSATASRQHHGASILGSRLSRVHGTPGREIEDAGADHASRNTRGGNVSIVELPMIPAEPPTVGRKAHSRSSSSAASARKRSKEVCQNYNADTPSMFHPAAFLEALLGEENAASSDKRSASYRATPHGSGSASLKCERRPGRRPVARQPGDLKPQPSQRLRRSSRRRSSRSLGDAGCDDCTSPVEPTLMPPPIASAKASRTLERQRSRSGTSVPERTEGSGSKCNAGKQRKSLPNPWDITDDEIAEKSTDEADKDGARIGEENEDDESDDADVFRGISKREHAELSAAAAAAAAAAGAAAAAVAASAAGGSHRPAHKRNGYDPTSPVVQARVKRHKKPRHKSTSSAPTVRDEVPNFGMSKGSGGMSALAACHVPDIGIGSSVASPEVARGPVAHASSYGSSATDESHGHCRGASWSNVSTPSFATALEQHPGAKWQSDDKMQPWQPCADKPKLDKCWSSQVVVQSEAPCAGFAQHGGFDVAGEVKKVKTPNYATLANARAPTLVRLARHHDLVTAAGAAATVATPTSSMPLAASAVYGAYEALGVELRTQRILGCSSGTIKELARWHLPYLLMVVCYASLIFPLAGIIEKEAPVVLAMLMLILISVAHVSRLAWCDRRLWAIVDKCAVAHAAEQLRGGLGGWGPCDSYFRASLSACLQALDATSCGRAGWGKPGSHVFLIRPQPHLWGSRRRRAALVMVRCVACLLSALCIMHVVLISVVGASGDAAGAAAVAVESAIAGVALLLFVFHGCSPKHATPRARETDLRLQTVEAAFNAMLDTLRPLLGGDAPPALPCAALHPFSLLGLSASSADGQRTYFPVRLVTRDRTTLRAEVSVTSPASFTQGHRRRPPPAAKTTAGLSVFQVECPLADLRISARSCSAIAPTELGKSAAGNPAALPVPLKTMIGGSDNVALTALAAMAVAAPAPQLSGRDGQEAASAGGSIWTASTASTQRSHGRGGPHARIPEETTHLAMAVATAMNRRCQSGVLEIFRVRMAREEGGCGRGKKQAAGVTPPKAPLDEPALLIALPLDENVPSEGARPAYGSFGACAAATFKALMSAVSRAGTRARSRWSPPSDHDGFPLGVAALPVPASASLGSSPSSLHNDAREETLGVLGLDELCSLCEKGRPKCLETYMAHLSNAAPWHPTPPDWAWPQQLGKPLPSVAPPAAGHAHSPLGGFSEASEATQLPAANRAGDQHCAHGAQHLAIIFDSHAERDRCLALLHEAADSAGEEAAV